MSTDNERSLRTAAVVGSIATVGAVAWGFYILAGIAISGYTLGRDVTTDVLAVLPPLAAGGALVYGAILAVRAVRDEDWLVRLIAVALFLIEGALGLTLFGYGAWEGSRVAYAHAARAAARGRSTQAVVQQGPITIVTPPRRADSAAAAPRTPYDQLSVRLTLVYACRGDWRRASVVEVASGQPLPAGANVCVSGIDVPGPCPACERPFKSYEPGPDESAEEIARAQAELVRRHRASYVEPTQRAVAAHRRWLKLVGQRFPGPHRLRVQVEPAPGVTRPADPADTTIWLYGYRVVYDRTDDLTTHAPPRRELLTVRALAPHPGAGRSVDRWVEVPHYDGAVYGIVVAPDSTVASWRARSHGIPPETNGPRSCYAEPVDAEPVAPPPWMTSVPPRLCLCCAQ